MPFWARFRVPPVAGVEGGGCRRRVWPFAGGAIVLACDVGVSS